MAIRHFRPRFLSSFERQLLSPAGLLRRQWIQRWTAPSASEMRDRPTGPGVVENSSPGRRSYLLVVVHIAVAGRLGYQSRDIIQPGFFVKVSCQKPAGFIFEHGVDANRMPAL